MVKLRVVGLNCGTSVDGIDVAQCLIESSPDNSDVAITLLSYREHAIPPELRNRVLSLCRPGAVTTLEEVCDLNFELGELFADAVLASDFDCGDIDIIASHGQTLWHNPVTRSHGIGYAGVQYLHKRLNGKLFSVPKHGPLLMFDSTITNDFRVAELAHGRMGAPLAGFFEASLLRHNTHLRVSQNIGGMGNVSVIPPLNSPLADTYDAFDTGPGNVLIDAAVRIITDGEMQYDRDGAMGLAGMSEIVERSWIDEWINSLPYLSQRPPKTTGRELFSDDMAADIVHQLKAKGVSDNGIIASITILTCETIARAFELFVIPEYGHLDEIFVCGGGANNPNIMKFLTDRFPTSRVANLKDAANTEGTSVPAEAKEAIMFALLGFLCVTGRSVPIAKGERSKDHAVLGKITPGSNYGSLLRAACAEESPGILGRISIKSS